MAHKTTKVEKEIKHTYQFKTGVNGWNDGAEVGKLIMNLTHNEALIIGYGIAAIIDKEIRFADVTGYNDLITRNAVGETLGNGIYLSSENAQGFFNV